MNPKPLVALNHFTVPTAIFGTPLAPRTLERESNDGYQHSTQPAWWRLVHDNDTPFLSPPVPELASVKIDADRVREWLRRGARPSDSARDLLVAQGILAGNPKRERGSVGLGAAAAPDETPAEVKPAAAAPEEEVVAEPEPVAVAK